MRVMDSVDGTNDAGIDFLQGVDRGKGIIYYMKDEYNNECPYDFKNIQFKRYPIISMTSGSTDLVFDADNQKMKYALKDSDSNIFPTGAIIDENDSSYYFTFNAIFHDSETYDIYDASVIQNGIISDKGGYFAVQNNKINEAHTSFDNPLDYVQISKLNNIVINNIINSFEHIYWSSGCYSNTFGNECQYNTFGSGYYSNTFGNNCNSNIFGESCYSNKFGNDCNSNTFGVNCTSNTFGNNCYSNTFGSNCRSNTFGDSCYDNKFGNNCYFNTFGYNCNSNTFGISFRSNTFGNECNSNTFGGNCYSNTFGNACNSNTFGENCYSNTFGDNCYSNTFGISFYRNTFGSNCESNTFDSNCESNTFGNICNSNKFGNNCERNTFGDRCGGNTFGDSCNYNTFGNGCGFTIFGINYHYNTFGNNCRFNRFYVSTANYTKKDYIRYIVLEDGCTNNNFFSSIITDSNNYLQKIRIKGLENTTTTNTQILLSEVNTNYEWVVAKNSSEVVKQYCPEDRLTNTNKLENKEVSNWVASTKYTDFGFQAQIDIADLTEADFVNVVFGVNEAVSGNYASAIEQYEGYILVFSKVDTTIIIPTIVITKIY